MQKLKSVDVALLGLLSLMYIFNISFGIFELIPDNLPFIGNLDEGGAVVLLIMCLRYFGINTKFLDLFERKIK